MRIYTVLILFVFSGCAAVKGQEKKQQKLFNDDSFEKDTYKDKWDKEESCCAYSITRSDSVARDGKYSIRFELNKDDKVISNGKRAEMLMSSESSANVERWYRFSIFVPENYGVDSVSEIVAQWHEVPDFSLGETWRSPPISLQIFKSNWQVNLLWATEPVNTNKTISGSKTLPLPELERGRWTDWIFHVKFSYKDDGILQVWKNDSLAIDYKGPNYYNDKRGPFFKIGIYKWAWKDVKTKSVVSSRVLYFDRIKITDDNNSFEKFSK